MEYIFEISIDYAKAINQANKLSKISNKCEDIRKNISKEIKYIENNWKGRTGDTLCEKLKFLKNKNRAVSEELEQVSATIKQVANDIKQADLDTSSIIRQ